jgi:hypothetical protein
MNHNTFFSVLFTLIFSTFFFTACDDGGENNNQQIDQDVKDWCEKWLYCSEDDRGYEYIPYETQEECEFIMQWVKNHKDGTYDQKKCYYFTLSLGDSPSSFGCGEIGDSWDLYSNCAYTPYGVCPDGPGTGECL